jgi:hypothetical protein
MMGRTRFATVASPAYLANHGVPLRPFDLETPYGNRCEG